MRTLQKVKEWHKAFNVSIINKPNIEDEDLNKLRVDLIEEEFNELKEALRTKNYVEVLDALSDLQYVLDGTYLSLGFHNVKEEAFNEVHQSNMSKLGNDGKPVYREDGKVLKGPNFKPPNLSKIINND